MKTTIKITGVTADTAGDTYDEGTPDNDNDSGISVANAMSTVRLYESSGALIAFIDSDDLWMPNKLQDQIYHKSYHSNLYSCSERIVAEQKLA